MLRIESGEDRERHPGSHQFNPYHCPTLPTCSQSLYQYHWMLPPTGDSWVGLPPTLFPSSTAPNTMEREDYHAGTYGEALYIISVESSSIAVLDRTIDSELELVSMS
ncbi:hypothetical protein SUGI_1228630 [Cryptomeria japonica]|uniref:Uncharacterized protein n=1 Tax=Cryptomeria japonica TaxID=3369 RepID=A0AAD3NP76_CRYJA|nr:hypothetical protein SUGI_1228630 [Cryptomeria japonica]